MWRFNIIYSDTFWSWFWSRSHISSVWISHIYRPQRSWGKVMFSQASVILLTGGSASVHAGIHTHPPWADPPGADTPPEQTPPGSRHPWSRHPPGADTPRADTPGADPPGAATPPEQTPPGADSPPEQTPPQEQTPPTTQHAGRYGQRAGGSHPTGMQSCS